MKSKIFLSLICFAALSLGVHAAETAGSTPASNRPKITDNSSASAEATSSKQQNTDDPKAKQEAAATDKEAAATDTKAAATNTKATVTAKKAAATNTNATVTAKQAATTDKKTAATDKQAEKTAKQQQPSKPKTDQLNDEIKNLKSEASKAKKDLNEAKKELTRKKNELAGLKTEHNKVKEDLEIEKNARNYAEEALHAKNAAVSYSLTGMIAACLGVVLLLVLGAFVYFILLPQLRSYISDLLQKRDALVKENKALLDEQFNNRKQLQDAEKAKAEAHRCRADLEKAVAEKTAALQEMDKQKAYLTALEGLRDSIGELLNIEVINLWGGKIPADTASQIVLLGMSKLCAMHKNQENTGKILREFQYFDAQLAEFFHNQEDLEKIRQAISPIIHDCLNDEYQIKWPTLNSNIADYKTEQELDLDGSDAGTMIVGVKCAMIYDVEDNDAPFQRAKVVCR